MPGNYPVSRASITSVPLHFAPDEHEAIRTTPSCTALFSTLASRKSPRLRQRGMENGHVANGQALANGHAIFGETLQKIESNMQEQENIFLFVPNLIGTDSPRPDSSPSDTSRLCPHRAGHLLPLLHASPPAHVLLSVQPVLHPGRIGWNGRPALQPIHHVRSCPGHGY